MVAELLQDGPPEKLQPVESPAAKSSVPMRIRMTADGSIERTAILVVGVKLGITWNERDWDPEDGWKRPIDC
jgi:hypothetical protein